MPGSKVSIVRRMLRGISPRYRYCSTPVVVSDISHRRSNVRKRITDVTAILKQQCKLPCTDEKYSLRPESKLLMINIEVSRPLNSYSFLTRDLSFDLCSFGICETWNCHGDLTLCSSDAAARNDHISTCLALESGGW